MFIDHLPIKNEDFDMPWFHSYVKLTEVNWIFTSEIECCFQTLFAFNHFGMIIPTLLLTVPMCKGAASGMCPCRTVACAAMLCRKKHWDMLNEKGCGWKTISNENNQWKIHRL